MSEPESRYTALGNTSGAFVGGAPVSVLQCEDCGAVVSHRVVHNRWHDAHPPAVERQGEVPAPNPDECPRVPIGRSGAIIPAGSRIPEPGLWVYPIADGATVDHDELRLRAGVPPNPMRGYTVEELTGVARIGAERVRQLEEEGWSTEHDDQWSEGELLAGAIAYVLQALGGGQVVAPKEMAAAHPPFDWWPWVDDDCGGFKPSPDDVRNLEKAGSMIAAEIDRRVRARAAVS